MSSNKENHKLLDATESYLNAGRYGTQTQAQFSLDFHKSYHAASLQERIEVSETLSSCRSVPLDVITLLCCDDDRVASPILSRSPLLSETDLTTQILQGTGVEREAIAERVDLNPVLVSHLMSFGEKPVARALLGNRAVLAKISNKLRGRIERLGDDEYAQAEHMGMTQDKEKLDALVSSMEQDWFEHYQPESQSSDELAMTTGQTASAAEPETTLIEEVETPVAEAEPLIDEDDVALLQKLNSSDWDQLDDAAIEALAEQLALEEMREAGVDIPPEAELIDGSGEDSSSFANPNRVFFKIGVHDAENAPIPPLELVDTSGRMATIAFNGQINADEPAPESAAVTAAEADALVQDEPVEDVASTETVSSYTESNDADLAAETVRAEQETQITADEAIAALKSLSKKVKAEASKDPQEERKPQITLTLRKKDAPTASGSDGQQLTAKASSVELSSTTENDWMEALSRLQAEYVPEDDKVTPAPSHSALANTAPVQETPTKDHQRADMPFEPLMIEEELELPTLSLNEKNEFPSNGERNRVETPPTWSAATLPAEPVQTQSQPLIHEHAPMGFMPDMVSFDGLDLIEAEPDLPSATELLLARQQAIPVVELVEPVELAYVENGKTVTLEEYENAHMQVVVEQLAAQREAAAAPKAIDHVAVTASTMSQPPEDLTDLPQMANHRVVEADTYEQMRSAEPETAQEPVNQGVPGWDQPVDLTEILNTTHSSYGISDSFYQYDDETRLMVLQTIIAETFGEAAQVTRDIEQRPSLDLERSQALVMARFSTDRVLLADLMHDISGHRRLDMTRLLQDKGGEALVVYLYHIGLDESSTLSMVLHGPDAIAHDYAKVSQLMTLYNQLYPAAARKIVEQLFGTPLQTKTPVHQPIHDDGAAQASPRLRGTGRSDHVRPAARTAPSFGRRQSGRE